MPAEHIAARLSAYATPEAAVTFDDDLDVVRGALSSFEATQSWDALAVAVFDHGNSPPCYSDRKFRFGHLRQQVAYYLTRMQAVADTAGDGVPLLLMDTAEAAVLGSLGDPKVASGQCKVVANLGNEHTLAFHLHGTLDGESVWREQGHGALVVAGGEEPGFLSVIGPMRGLLEGSRLSPYFATPHGSMMLAGCFGLVRAWAERQPSKRNEILHALRSVGEALAHDH